jgi:hypothetical protein
MAGGRRVKKSRSTRRNKKGGSAPVENPTGYSLGGEYSPKELGYGALASPSPYKKFSHCN